jgi:hypothetical protein
MPGIADAVWFSLFTALSRALLVKMGWKEAMEHDYQGQPILEPGFILGGSAIRK